MGFLLIIAFWFFIFKYVLGDSSKDIEYSQTVSSSDIDNMTGSQFEYFIASLFKKMGYKTYVTKSSGDQGVDIIAQNNVFKIAIQTKCYHNRVGNKAIQEVTAGMRYYGCNKGMVITNSYFTNSAIELANANDIELWDRHTLEEKIKRYN